MACPCAALVSECLPLRLGVPVLTLLCQTLMCLDMPALRHLTVVPTFYYPHVGACRQINMLRLLYLDMPAIVTLKSLPLGTKLPAAQLTLLSEKGLAFIPTFSGFYVFYVFRFYTKHDCHGADLSNWLL